MDSLPRTITSGHRDFMAAKHNDPVVCPSCGCRAILKNKGTCKSARSLEEWSKVILFHVREKNEVYAQAYYVRKMYGPGRWRAPVEYMSKALYLLRPGEALQWKWKHDYTGYGMTLSGKRIVEGWDRSKTICEPFQACSMFMMEPRGVHAIGLERLKESFLAYCQYETWSGVSAHDYEEHFDIMKYLGAATMRPQIEMLVKAGLKNIVNDLVLYKRKLSRDIKWFERDPCKAFNLSTEELREFGRLDGTAAFLRWYKALRKAGLKMEFTQILKINKEVGADVQDRFYRTCVTGCGVHPERALRYLKKFCDKQHWLSSTIITWADYVSSAKYCGYDLKDQLVLMPKKLQEAHDGATATEIELRYERETQDDGPYQVRYRTLMERYGYEDDQFLIRAPSSSREIIQEGKTLHHCVGRYAGAHARGTTTILFMRRRQDPFKSAWTIEMHGDRMVQVQGERDQYENHPQKKARVFMDEWLAWVAAGSKRDKDGKPKMPKKKEVAVA